jgi:hypothetical protein
MRELSVAWSKLCGIDIDTFFEGNTYILKHYIKK